MLDPDITIVNSMQDARWNIDGTATAQIRVEYMVGKFGPYSVRFADEGFTKAARDEALNALARERRA